MKKRIYSTALLSLCFIFVYTQKNKTEIKNYAEISTKVGGKWEGKKYIGGVFKNVQKLILPPEHTDHSFDIRYEGPGWESNKIAYRLYLDWRNAIDIFGKKTDTIVLPFVGQDNFDSYHEIQDWGSDILKVGKGLGIGSLDRIINNEKQHFHKVKSTIVSITNKKSFSKVKIEYKDWQTLDNIIDLTSELSIKPDNRFTEHIFKTSKKIEGICTGIVKIENTFVVNKIDDYKKWAYLATYGKQSLVPDNLGMAIFYKVDSVEKQLDVDSDHLLVFKPTTNAVRFYFLGAWEQEKSGIKTKDEFINYLDDLLLKLNNENKL